MAVTATTIENLTTVAITGANAGTTIFTPSAAEIGRFRLRVIRLVCTGATAADTVSITGTTPTASGTETQTLWLAVVSAATFTDQTSFPDECEFRGTIKVVSTGTLGGTATLFLHHG